MLTYGCICSGIGGASLAWMPLGMRPAFHAEINPFACAVLARRWPQVPNLGDITSRTFLRRARDCGRIDLLVGGTPCDSFSTTGKRKGLADPRGRLALRFVEIAHALEAEWIVWENVPGALSVNKGRFFSTFLGHLARGGYGFGWRVVCASVHGLPQKRRRLFLVGRSGGRCPTEVLLEPPGEGHPSAPPTVPQGQSSSPARGRPHQRVRFPSGRVAQVPFLEDLPGQMAPVPFHLHLTRTATIVKPAQVSPPLLAQGHEGGLPWTAFPLVVQTNPHALPSRKSRRAGESPPPEWSPGDLSLDVRRLTPEEEEILQGIPPGHTAISVRQGRSWKPASDQARYRAIGAALPIPVLAWIGRRILEVVRGEQST